MTAAVTLELGAGSDATLELIKRFGVTAIRGAERGMARGAVAIENEAITRHLQGQTIGRRSSTLLRSLVSGVRTDSDGLPIGFVGVRSDSPAARYAATQHEGTVGKGGRFPDIVPINAKALAVPLRAALDSKGISIFSGPRDPALAGQLFKIDRDGRPPLLARGIAGGSIEPLFVLLKKVAIEPKPFITLAARAVQGSGRLARFVSEAIAREIARQGGRTAS